MKIKTYPIFILVITLLQISCSNSYFIPGEVNDLKLKAKGDLNLAVSGDESFLIRPQNFQLGYSPLQHVGIFASHYNNRIAPNSQHYLLNFNRRYSKVGLGTYFFHPQNPFIKKKYRLFKNTNMQSGFLVDAYAGIGHGKFGHNNIVKQYNYTFSFRKLFFQTGFHWQGNIGGFSIFYNFGKTNIYQGNANGRLHDYHLQNITAITDNNRFNTHEFAANVHLGIKYGRVYFNYNYIRNNFTQIYRPRYLANLGIAINIHDIFLVYKNK